MSPGRLIVKLTADRLDKLCLQSSEDEGTTLCKTATISTDEELSLMTCKTPTNSTDGEDAGPIRTLGCFGLLPPELWRPVALCLDPRSLCKVEAASWSCRAPMDLETELWANLCQLHFPTMYASVLADYERGRTWAEALPPFAKPSPKLGPSGKANKKKQREEPRDRTADSPTNVSTRGGRRAAGTGQRTPWWRRESQGAQDGNSSVAEGTSDTWSPPILSSMRSTPQLEGSVDSRSTRASPSPLFEPSSPDVGFFSSLGDVDEELWLPAPALELEPEAEAEAAMEEETTTRLAGPFSSQAFSPLPPPAVDQESGPTADWRSLYVRRWQKKAQWGSAKKPTGSCETSPLLAPVGKSDAEVKRVSELTRRELGRLCDAAHRLKICTLCGEKFSPGEARSEHTACRFHPGDFMPTETKSWSGPELKQLRFFVRQALRNAGGSSWVERHPRASRGRGHWLRGLGVVGSGKEKFRLCLEGDSPATWSCCGAKGLFAEGCDRGMHRHF